MSAAATHSSHYRSPASSAATTSDSTSKASGSVEQATADARRLQERRLPKSVRPESWLVSKYVRAERMEERAMRVVRKLQRMRTAGAAC